jgi:hypothetical protein
LAGFETGHSIQEGAVFKRAIVDHRILFHVLSCYCIREDGRTKFFSLTPEGRISLSLTAASLILVVSKGTLSPGHGRT